MTLDVITREEFELVVMGLLSEIQSLKKARGGDYLTMDQARERYGLTPSTIRRRVEEGNLKFYRDGKRNFLKVGELEALRNKKTLGREEPRERK